MVSGTGDKNYYAVCQRLVLADSLRSFVQVNLRATKVIVFHARMNRISFESVDHLISSETLDQTIILEVNETPCTSFDNK